ncbi:MAG: 1-acyl-sn-glycerol-3-phosphate acyltransferase [Alphaproteobacteria bacterium]|nr:1-acyl-sn-glycerol-3-phosphate acyltransferase [Alphaproteobacteria bacterium]
MTLTPVTVLRASAFNLLFYGLTAVMALAAVPVALVSRGLTRRMVKLWSRSTEWLLATVVGLRVEIRGKHHLPSDPCLITSKHQSALETIMATDLLGDPAVVLKKELLRIPVWGWHAKQQRHVVVDRTAGAAALRRMRDDAKAALAAGRPVLIFPQGTRVAPGAKGVSYKPGVAGLYQALQVPVVPVALNTGLFWGRKSYTKFAGTAVIEFLPPIEPGLGKRAFLDRLESDIETASDRLEREALAAQPDLAKHLAAGPVSEHK